MGFWDFGGFVVWSWLSTVKCSLDLLFFLIFVALLDEGFALVSQAKRCGDLVFYDTLWHANIAIFRRHLLASVENFRVECDGVWSSRSNRRALTLLTGRLWVIKMMIILILCTLTIFEAIFWLAKDLRRAHRWLNRTVCLRQMKTAEDREFSPSSEA